MKLPVALVTAANGGIGSACARELVTRGYHVVLMSRSTAASALAEELGGVGLQGSVAEPEDLQRAVDLAMSTHGKIDAVVNNTGHAPGSTSPSGKRFDANAEARLLDITDDEWHQTLDLFFLNVVRLSRLVTPILQKQKSGSIVNISAFAAREPAHAYPASSTIRFALAGFMKLYSDRYARDGIRMNNVLPGYIDNWEWPEEVVDRIPMGRPGNATEIARVVAFLLSPEASYVTGQSILADGGHNRSL